MNKRRATVCDPIMRLGSLIVLMCLAAWGQAQVPAIFDEEALRLAHRIEDATNKRDGGEINRLMDNAAFIKNVRKHSRVLQDSGMFARLRSAISINLSHYGDNIVASLSKGGCKFLREYEKNGVKHILFRIYANGINYYDYILVRLKDSIRASDVFVIGADDWQSNSMGQFMDAISQDLNVAKLEESERIAVQLTRQKQKADFEGVRKSYEQLDEKLRENRFIEDIYIKACYHIDLALYEKAVQHFVERYPDAICSYIMLGDVYLGKEEYGQSIEALHKVDSLIGGDPSLNFMEGNVYAKWGKRKESIDCYQKAFEFDPGLTVNMLALVSRYAAAGQTDKALAIIDRYKKVPNFKEEDLKLIYTSYPALNKGSATPGQ